MSKVKKGDIVGRKSYNSDILFKVIDLDEGDSSCSCAKLKGIDLRLCADAPLSDLEVKSQREVSEYRLNDIKKSQSCMKRILTRRNADLSRFESKISRKKGEFFNLPGRILHLDGDEEYLEKCLNTYEQLNLDAIGFYVPESKQPEVILDYLKEYNFDILVLTGHDALQKKKKGFVDINNYQNSKYFVEAVKKVRRIVPSRDNLVIFAGACQSHYEALLAAGANFASSPQRIMIHAFDPVFIVEKVAYSSINDILLLDDIISDTITGEDGVGGVETRGRMRLGYPKSPY
ncbi:spore coat assembly protein [Desulfitispora alkaliphila]|uniref:sporulation peptidase YabG n=1 Tax=Desulfitispora alkaliphila TaxID=622674 RepID=UPI003D1E8076